MNSQNLCRVCGAEGHFKLLHEFGQMPVAGYLVSDAESAKNAPTFGLMIVICDACGHVQVDGGEARQVLVDTVYADYQPTYSASATLPVYIEGLVQSGIDAASAEPGDIVLEIGCNDGSLLRRVKELGLTPVGYEPAESLAATAAKEGIKIFTSLFNEQSAPAMLEEAGRAKLVLARHVLEHSFEPVSFLKGIAAVLDDDGMAVIEVPHIGLQIMNGQFQSMGFQHESYFSVLSLSAALDLAGLQIADIRFVRMDGGSMVVFAGRKGAGNQSRSATRIIETERSQQLHRSSGYDGAFDRFRKTCERCRMALSDIASSGGSVAAYGAGGKGQSLLNMLAVDSSVVGLVLDDTPGNAGRFIPGVALEVAGGADPRAADVDAMLVTAPTHVTDIVRKEAGRAETGTLFMATVPDFHCLTPELV